MRYIIICMALMTVALPSAASSQPSSEPWPHVRNVEILKQAYQRLYFNAGTDVRIYPGCRFSVLVNDSIELTGVIEYSHPGIAISETLELPIGIPLPDSGVANIDLFGMDMFSEIRFGYLDSNVARYAVELPYPDTSWYIRSDRLPNPVSLRRYDSQLEMLFDFEAGKIDGIFTDYDPKLQGVPTVHLSAPAPWVVALLPNPASPRSRSGYVTTSLFYRFDPASIALFFDGDSAEAYHALTPTTNGASRPYPFDPATGRRLIRELPASTTSIRIAVDYPSLSGTAAYFADILSRDRLKTSLTTEVTVDSCADVLITTLPHSETQPLLTLDSAVARLKRMLPGGSQITNNIEQAAFHLQAAHDQPDSLLRQAALHRVVQKLQQDIGVFALFRPRIYFTCQPTIVGIERQESPPFDLRRLLLLEPPPYLRSKP